MSKRQEITNQIIFVAIIIFIILLLWGYGAGWFGASADVSVPNEQQKFFPGVANGIKKLYNSQIFQDERNLRYAL